MPALTHEQLQGRLNDLVECLQNGSQIWRTNPFHQQHPNWVGSQPALAKHLSQLSSSQVSTLQTESHRLYTELGDYYPLANRLSAICELPPLSVKPPSPPRAFNALKERKWQQIWAFSAAIGETSAPIVEWCAGKGHLGRWLSHQFATEVMSLEWDQQLCKQGESLAKATDMDQHFNCVDVLSTDVVELIKPEHHIVALHACGDLHRQMLQTAATNRASRITLSPCCYQLTSNDTYQPMSAFTRSFKLPLSRNELRLAVQESTTSGQRHRVLREKEMTFRLGFQELLRDELPEFVQAGVPSISKSKLNHGFEWFCQWAAEAKGYVLPASPNWQSYLCRGQERWHHLERYQLANHLFRRALELYLVFDNALYLAESGYQVRLFEFAQRQCTPRNLVIDAFRLA